MASTNDYVLFNAAVGTTAVPSAAVPMGQQNNAVSIVMTLFSGSTPAGAVTVQESNDMQSWSSVGTVAAFDTKAGPNFLTGSQGSIAMKYVRVLVKSATGYVIVNVTLNPYRA